MTGNKQEWKKQRYIKPEETSKIWLMVELFSLRMEEGESVLDQGTYRSWRTFLICAFKCTFCTRKANIIMAVEFED